MVRKVDEAKRAEIAAAALALLRERGVHEATMSALADALGMKRTTLYWYFPDLRAIFAWLLERVYQDEDTFVASRLAGSGLDHPIDVLIAWLEADLAFWRERELGDVLLLVSHFWATGSPEGREAFRDLTARHVLPVRTLMVGALAHGLADGRVAPCDPEAVVDFALTFLQGSLVTAGLGLVDGQRSFTFVRAHVLEPLRRRESR